MILRRNALQFTERQKDRQMVIQIKLNFFKFGQFFFILPAIKLNVSPEVCLWIFFARRAKKQKRRGSQPSWRKSTWPKEAARYAHSSWACCLHAELLDQLGDAASNPSIRRGFQIPVCTCFFYFTITLVFYSWSHNKNILVRKILCSNLDVYVNSVSYDDAWTYVNYNVFFFITIVIWARY